MSAWGLAYTARPKQWVKNLLVVAAAAAADSLGHPGVPLRVALACAAFCLVASGIYAINDVHDVDEDRRHPTKRHRPIAAGTLSPNVALIAGIIWIVSGLAICLALGVLVALVALGYLTLTLTYTFVWRHIPLLDIVAIAGGFVLRAVAGGVAANVHLSTAFLLVVAFASVLLASGKRLAELMRAESQGSARRRVLQTYTIPALRLLMVATMILTLLVYCLWAFAVRLRNGDIPWRALTVIPFLAGILRYMILVASGAGEAPEAVLYGDGVMRGAATAWLTLFVLEVGANG